MKTTKHILRTNEKEQDQTLESREVRLGDQRRRHTRKGQPSGHFWRESGRGSDFDGGTWGGGFWGSCKVLYLGGRCKGGCALS